MEIHAVREMTAFTVQIVAPLVDLVVLLMILKHVVSANHIDATKMVNGLGMEEAIAWQLRCVNKILCVIGAGFKPR